MKTKEVRNRIKLLSIILIFLRVYSRWYSGRNMKIDYNNCRKCAIGIYRVCVDTVTLLALHSDTLQAARQIIIFPTEAG